MNESKNSGEVEEVIPVLLAVLMGGLHFDLDMKDFSYSLSELTDSKFIIFSDMVKLLFLFGYKLNIIWLNEKYLRSLEIIINLMYVIEHHSFYRNSSSCFFFFWNAGAGRSCQCTGKITRVPGQVHPGDIGGQPGSHLGGGGAREHLPSGC
ncbi:hypothetical protein [Akkermansia sp.]|uniref:hypothetical protein n=1 Tax=Akkermansia sp. TaxID=1872421 RepID=UPI003AB2A226